MSAAFSGVAADLTNASTAALTVASISVEETPGGSILQES
jgi:hypothetical protein